MIVIKSLDSTPFDDIYAAFQEAFRDYERKWSQEEFRRMLQRRGFAPELSFGAFEGNQLVSFIFNGIGSFNGRRTAYDTGTGTLEQYRNKGLVSQLFQTSLPYLQEAGCSQYLLEVLTENTAAISVYTKQGFETNRMLNYFFIPATDIALIDKVKDVQYQLRETNLDELQNVQAFWDFYPSWQNNHESVARSADHFKMIAALHNGELCGYGIIEPDSGDITQLAVSKTHRRKGIGTVLFQTLLAQNQNNHIKIVNTDSGCNTIKTFLAAHGIKHSGTQLEMIKNLSFS